MKYKVGDSFMFPAEIEAIDADKTASYFVYSCAGIGWWSESALDDVRKLDCTDCKWKGTRHQRCSCCIRNTKMKDNYQYK
jgi:hypothetical protein|nr:MAG TPA: hypothetical protein [Caudoviricetes sp.]